MLRTFTLDYRPLGRCFSLWLCLLFSTFGALANNGDKPFAEAGNPALPEAQPLPRFKAKIPQEYAAIIRERELQREIAAMPAALTYRQFGELETQTASTYTAADLFLEEGILLTPNSFDSVQYYIGQARAVLGKIRETGNYIRNFDAKTKVYLPAGIPKTI
ncbi:MAG: hypothetical protein KY428_06390, partial [Bacteroidetes bacterium]|nr:hypothetical protein [Bacteroidota bacterium]